jgi:hypothetical protein
MFFFANAHTVQTELFDLLEQQAVKLIGLAQTPIQVI